MTGLLQEYVRRQAEDRADAVALVQGDQTTTYGDLEQESSRIARQLQDAGCRRGDRVCLLLPKSPEAISAMLGVLKADCAYVPVDVASPAARVLKIISAADPRLVLVTTTSAGLLDELIALGLAPESVIATVGDDAVEGQSFRTAFSAVDRAAFSVEAPVCSNSPDDAAHILFTSGSTGDPKGVVITHANVIPFVEWAVDYFGTSPTDRISGQPPLHFDLSTYDVFGTFCAGAQLHLVPTAMNLMPQRLAQLIRDAELTQWFSVPSVLTYMAKFDVIKHGDFPSLERVLWCGEVLPTPILVHWMDRLPHARFTNLYGPTEATIASSYFTVPATPASPTDPIPIGIPCPGEELHILDDMLQPCPVGETGDLFISGVGLSPGYWRDDEKTHAAFHAHPTAEDPAGRIYRTGDLARLGKDGFVYFLGRADSQIKSRGHRIELGEIETALNALAYIEECAVVGIDTDGFEGTAIACAYDAADDSVNPAQIREGLRKTLPSYMLPSRWLVMNGLPKNVNGKIDRRKLQDLFAELDDHEPATLST